MNIEKEYKKFLKTIVKHLDNNKSTYDSELRKAGNRLFGKKFKGVFPKDKIPIMKNKDMCIFNLDKSNESGSHWCAMYKDGKHKVVYDSFGRKVMGKGYKYTDKDKEQKKKEENCGQRCLAWLCCAHYYGINEAKLI